jgi:prevent-host-death family protein
MNGPNLAKDIKPVSEFRANSAAMIDHVQRSGRPLVLTVHGRSAIVLLDVRVFETMREELELLRDLRVAEAQIDRGEGVSHDEARRRILQLAEK